MKRAMTRILICAVQTGHFAKRLLAYLPFIVLYLFCIQQGAVVIGRCENTP
jgi:hypothetical protein